MKTRIERHAIRAARRGAEDRRMNLVDALADGNYAVRVVLAELSYPELVCLKHTAHQLVLDI